MVGDQVLFVGARNAWWCSGGYARDNMMVMTKVNGKAIVGGPTTDWRLEGAIRRSGLP